MTRRMMLKNLAAAMSAVVLAAAANKEASTQPVQANSEAATKAMAKAA